VEDRARRDAQRDLQRRYDLVGEDRANVVRPTMAVSRREAFLERASLGRFTHRTAIPQAARRTVRRL
jgi:hypothetical protein